MRILIPSKEPEILRSHTSIASSFSDNKLSLEDILADIFCTFRSSSSYNFIGTVSSAMCDMEGIIMLSLAEIFDTSSDMEGDWDGDSNDGLLLLDRRRSRNAFAGCCPLSQDFSTTFRLS